jgi:hypothetical protein
MFQVGDRYLKIASTWIRHQAPTPKDGSCAIKK